MAAENMQKVKLLKLYEFLRKETDEQHPVSRRNLCDKLNEMGISSNVRTLSLDIKVLQDNGFEVMSFMKNGSLYDIDRGADPDYTISQPSKYYDRQALTDYINSLY